MKKKNIIMIAAAVIVLLCIALLIDSVVREKKKWSRMYEDTDYPCRFKVSGDSLEFELQSKANGELAWQAEVEEDHSQFVDVVPDGKETGKRVRYKIAPKAVGRVEITFSKSRELGDNSIRIVELTVPVFVYETGDGIAVTCTGGCYLVDMGGEMGGTDTDSPYLLLSREDGEGRICFAGSSMDWTLSEENEAVWFIFSTDEDGMEYCSIVPKKDQELNTVNDKDTDTDAESNQALSKEQLEQLKKESGEEEDPDAGDEEMGEVGREQSSELAGQEGEEESAAEPDGKEDDDTSGGDTDGPSGSGGSEAEENDAEIEVTEDYIIVELSEDDVNAVTVEKEYGITLTHVKSGKAGKVKASLWTDGRVTLEKGK